MSTVVDHYTLTIQLYLFTVYMADDVIMICSITAYFAFSILYNF